MSVTTVMMDGMPKAGAQILTLEGGTGSTITDAAAEAEATIIRANVADFKALLLFELVFFILNVNLALQGAQTLTFFISFYIEI